MRKNLLRVGLLSFIAAGLASCGGEAAQPLTATTAASVLGQLNTVLGQLPRSNAAPTLPIAGATTAAHKPGAATLAIDCETVTPTTPVDADADGIALSKTGTFDCASQTVGTSVYTRKGSYSIADLDDTVAGLVGGMRADFNVTAYDRVDSATGNESHEMYEGFWQYKGDGAGGMTSTSEFNGQSSYKAATANVNTKYDYGYTWAWAHKPDTPAAKSSRADSRCRELLRANASRPVRLR